MRLAKQLASESQLADAMAGVGRVIAKGNRIRDVGYLTDKYGGHAADWVKKSTSKWTAKDGMRLETHWYENPVLGIKVEFKSNFWWGRQ